MVDMRIGVAQRPRLGEAVCGDACVVAPSGTRELVGIVDGVGHGPEAAEAARRFVAHVLGDLAAPLDAILTGAHAALTGSRGVAATLLRIDAGAGRLEFAGVGNVNLVALAATPIHPAPQAGMVGRTLRRVRVHSFAIGRGDIVVLFSDGISSRVQLTPFLHLDPDAMAGAILDAHGVGHDDATCIALQFA